ncbi:MAG: hypothetical protein M1822_000109 [Bathelium mastoideum]|nr:MAG: hypothetical protein M1822_000109 [Bathelium mastoideum]
MAEDGTYNRDGSVDPRVKDRRFIANRIATFLPGNKVVLGGSVEDFAKALVSPFTIILCPATILCGTFSMINFGWGIAVTNLLSIFLQSPYPAGYGFNPQQNAGFLFALWMGAFAAQTWGILVNDRLPLWIAKQRGGHWRPEYRLHSLWFPGLFILPVGLGIFGVALQYHLHYMVLALGAFLSIFGSNSVMTVPINYLVETFPQNPQEVGTAMNLWRNAISVSVQFFISPWTKAVGIGWVFGMMAFFSVFAFMLIIILMMFGPRIRMVRLGHVGNSEEEKEIEEK